MDMVQINGSKLTSQLESASNKSFKKHVRAEQTLGEHRRQSNPTRAHSKRLKMKPSKENLV